MAITVYSAQVVGLEARPISVEVDISPGLHIFSIVGLADKEVQESRERIAAAIKNLGALAPHKKSQRVIINLAPADIKKEGPAFDLPIALGYLLASGQVDFDPRAIMFLGELGLDGTLRKVAGVLPIALVARAAGFSTIVVPQGNGAEVSTLENITIYEAKSLLEVIEHLSGRTLLTHLPNTPFSGQIPSYPIDFKDIKGQESAKLALEIAAAGGHNCLMSGPPGVGKTILAQAITSILPPLSFEEAIEINKIYSVSGMLDEKNHFILHRPFRNPHHSASYVSIIGGGTNPRPGEITLSHRGVLFLDELPEFDRRVIESLRQPIEERRITITRSSGVETFPAHFICISAMNPCPCGNFGSPIKDCICSPGSILKYKKKISGPMLDRTDLYVETSNVPYEQIEGLGGEESAKIRERVVGARAIQKKRFAGLPIYTNAEMGLREIKQFIVLSDNLKSILRKAYVQHNLSTRAYHRILKLSRTIADLGGSKEIEENHIFQALKYRPKNEL